MPEFDYVDVAGQPKKPKPTKADQKRIREMEKDMENEMKKSLEREEKVLVKFEYLKDQMKLEVQMGDLRAAKRIEEDLEKIMKEEGYDWN